MPLRVARTARRKKSGFFAIFSSEAPSPAMGNRITSPKYASFSKPAFSATVCHGTEITAASTWPFCIA